MDLEHKSEEDPLSSNALNKAVIDEEILNYFIFKEQSELVDLLLKSGVKSQKTDLGKIQVEVNSSDCSFRNLFELVPKLISQSLQHIDDEFSTLCFELGKHLVQLKIEEHLLKETPTNALFSFKGLLERADQKGTEEYKAIFLVFSKTEAHRNQFSEMLKGLKKMHKKLLRAYLPFSGDDDSDADSDGEKQPFNWLSIPAFETFVRQTNRAEAISLAKKLVHNEIQVQPSPNLVQLYRQSVQQNESPAPQPAPPTSIPLISLSKVAGSMLNVLPKDAIHRAQSHPAVHSFLRQYYPDELNASCTPPRPHASRAHAPRALYPTTIPDPFPRSYETAQAIRRLHHDSLTPQSHTHHPHPFIQTQSPSLGDALADHRYPPTAIPFDDSGEEDRHEAGGKGERVVGYSPAVSAARGESRESARAKRRPRTIKNMKNLHQIPKKTRRINMPWESWEVNNLQCGVVKDNFQWAKILHDETLRFKHGRTSTDLKDKFRNMWNRNRKRFSTMEDYAVYLGRQNPPLQPRLPDHSRPPLQLENVDGDSQED